MSKSKSLLSVILLFCCCPSIYAQKYDRNVVNKFCDKNAKTHVNGYINPLIKSMPPGKYLYPNGGTLLLYRSNRYLLKLPIGYQKNQGTSYPDLMGSGGIAGGCSKQQLTELFRNQNLIATRFILTKPYY